MTVIRLSRVMAPVRTLGPGRRVAVWVQGCTLACPGCASADTWDPAAGVGTEVDSLVAELAATVVAQDLDGLVITGGEPLQQHEAVLAVIDGLTEVLGERRGDVVLFTGYAASAARRLAPTLLDRCAVVVAGPYRAPHSGDEPLVATDNQQVLFASAEAERRFRRWQQSLEARLEMTVDDNDLFLVGVPRQGDLRAFVDEMSRRGVTFDSVSWRG